MRRSVGQFSGPESSLQIRSLADFITTTSESRFSVHTGRGKKGKASETSGFSQVRLREARAVLRHSQELGEPVRDRPSACAEVMQYEPNQGGDADGSYR
jgi:hypothetical protein